MPPRSPVAAARKSERLRVVYAEVFGHGERTRAQEMVLADLARWCHADDTTLVPGDPHASASLEGRRQVWLRLQHNLSLRPIDVQALAEGLAREEERD